jgi:hypothetical protein
VKRKPKPIVDSFKALVETFPRGDPAPVGQTGVLPDSDGHAGVGNTVFRLQREVVDLAFEVEKLAGQRAALPDAGGAQFRKRAFGDALANRKGVDGRACRLRQNFRVGLFGPSSLGEDARHCRFEHDAKCIEFVFVAFPLQPNGRLNLLLRDGGLRLASGYFSVGRFNRRPDCSPRRQHS